MLNFEIFDVIASTIIGTKSYERLLPSKLLVSLDVQIEMPKEDSIENALCYESIYDHIVFWSKDKTFLLVESYICELAKSLKIEFGLKKFTVKVIKKAAARQKSNVVFYYKS